jgi:hypothetical protein
MAAPTGCTRTLPTQPEYGTCFIDVGCEVENYGADPVEDQAKDNDKAIDCALQDHMRGAGPHLVRAIAEVLAQIRKHPSTAPATDPLRSDDHDQDAPRRDKFPHVQARLRGVQAPIPPGAAVDFGCV